MPIYTVRVHPGGEDTFFTKLKEIYPDREVIQSIYNGETLIVYELELDEDSDLTLLKLCVQEVKQIPSKYDRSDILDKIAKGLV